MGRKWSWPVVPISEKQMRDVNSSDLLRNGLYRKCDIYKGGGGYDEFNAIYSRRFGVTPNSTQFVVQLFGCPLSCPYCYVTKDGVFGKPTYVDSDSLLHAYDESNVDTFHLMGGAPALYLEYWREIADRVRVFHSDFILVEKLYDRKWLDGLTGLFAVSLKDFSVDYDLLWRNLSIVVESGISFYLTFTGKPALRRDIVQRYGEDILRDSIVIPIRHYEALDKS